MLEADALGNLMLSPEIIKRAKGEEKNYYQRSLPKFKPAPKVLEETSAVNTIEWLNMWHARYLEENLF